MINWVRIEYINECLMSSLKKLLKELELQNQWAN